MIQAHPPAQKIKIAHLRFLNVHFCGFVPHWMIPIDVWLVTVSSGGRAGTLPSYHALP